MGALFLYAFDPTIVAHSYLVTTDVGLAVFTVLFLWTLYRYLQKPTLQRLLLAGATMGLMLCAKFSGVLRASRGRTADAGGALVAGAGIGGAAAQLLQSVCGRSNFVVEEDVLVCRLLWDDLQRRRSPSSISPIFLPVGSRSINAGAHTGEQQSANPSFLAYMGGHLDHRFRSYLAVCYLLKEPIASIILVILGLFELRRTKEVSLLQQLFLLLPLVFLLPAYFMWADNAGIRYLIPALPFVYLIGGLGLMSLFRQRAILARGAAALLLAWMIVEAAGIYPDHLSYFNEAACLIPGKVSQVGLDGGSACGPLWLDDSNVDWGQGSKQLKSWVGKNIPGRTFQLAAFLVSRQAVTEFLTSPSVFPTS